MLIHLMEQQLRLNMLTWLRIIQADKNYAPGTVVSNLAVSAEVQAS